MPLNPDAAITEVEAHLRRRLGHVCETCGARLSVPMLFAQQCPNGHATHPGGCGCAASPCPPCREDETERAAEALRELGSRRRELGESEQPEAERKLMRRLETVQMERMKQIPNPGADPRLMDAATILVECAYVDGDFGEGERDEEWLRFEANGLAAALQGAYEDWHFQMTERLS